MTAQKAKGFLLIKRITNMTKAKKITITKTKTPRHAPPKQPAIFRGVITYERKRINVEAMQWPTFEASSPFHGENLAEFEKQLGAIGDWLESCGFTDDLEVYQPPQTIFGHVHVGFGIVEQPAATDWLVYLVPEDRDGVDASELIIVPDNKWKSRKPAQSGTKQTETDLSALEVASYARNGRTYVMARCPDLSDEKLREGFTDWLSTYRIVTQISTGLHPTKKDSFVDVSWYDGDYVYSVKPGEWLRMHLDGVMPSKPKIIPHAKAQRHLKDCAKL